MWQQSVGPTSPRGTFLSLRNSTEIPEEKAAEKSGEGEKTIPIDNSSKNQTPIIFPSKAMRQLGINSQENSQETSQSLKGRASSRKEGGLFQIIIPPLRNNEKPSEPHNAPQPPVSPRKKEKSKSPRHKGEQQYASERVYSSSKVDTGRNHEHSFPGMDDEWDAKRKALSRSQPKDVDGSRPRFTQSLRKTREAIAERRRRKRAQTLLKEASQKGETPVIATREKTDLKAYFEEITQKRLNEFMDNPLETVIVSLNALSIESKTEVLRAACSVDFLKELAAEKKHEHIHYLFENRPAGFTENFVNAFSLFHPYTATILEDLKLIGNVDLIIAVLKDMDICRIQREYLDDFIKDERMRDLKGALLKKFFLLTDVGTRIAEEYIQVGEMSGLGEMFSHVDADTQTQILGLDFFNLNNLNEEEKDQKILLVLETKNPAIIGHTLAQLTNTEKLYFYLNGLASIKEEAFKEVGKRSIYGFELALACLECEDFASLSALFSGLGPASQEKVQQHEFFDFRRLPPEMRLERVTNIHRGKNPDLIHLVVTQFQDMDELWTFLNQSHLKEPYMKEVIKKLLATDKNLGVPLAEKCIERRGMRALKRIFSCAPSDIREQILGIKFFMLDELPEEEAFERFWQIEQTKCIEIIGSTLLNMKSYPARYLYLEDVDDTNQSKKIIKPLAKYLIEHMDNQSALEFIKIGIARTIKLGKEFNTTLRANVLSTLLLTLYQFKLMHEHQKDKLIALLDVIPEGRFDEKRLEQEGNKVLFERTFLKVLNIIDEMTMAPEFPEEIQKLNCHIIEKFTEKFMGQELKVEEEIISPRQYAETLVIEGFFLRLINPLLTCHENYLPEYQAKAEVDKRTCVHISKLLQTMAGNLGQFSKKVEQLKIFDLLYQQQIERFKRMCARLYEIPMPKEAEN